MLLFSCNSGWTNATQRDFIRTVPVLFCSPPRFICVVHPEEGNTAQDVTPALWACILEVSGCILSCVVDHTVLRGFLKPFLSNARRWPHLGHDSFLTNPFPFIFTNHITAHVCSLRFRENHQAGRKNPKSYRRQVSRHVFTFTAGTDRAWSAELLGS